MSKITRQELKMFRTNFQNSVKDLEKQFNIKIDLGKITFEDYSFRCKLTATRTGIPTNHVKSTDDGFQVGDVVKINHKSIDPNRKFTVIKINNKNIKVQDIKNPIHNYSVSPYLLIKA